ncbi:MAG TPA: signal peptidase II [Nocardioidaceae bacterium]|nr:signal peptidase II [Nocardioidaceae bacterium]
MQAAPGASLTTSDDNNPSDGQGSRRPLLLFFIVAVTAYALDLGTKILAVEKLTGEPPVEVVGSLLKLNLARNPGAAFSTGTSYTVVLSCIAVGAVAVVLWYSRRLASPLWAVGLGCLLGGVLGNLTDRIFREPGVMRGHVVDFLQLPNWPVFNVADICINVAAGVIILQAIRGVSIAGHREKKRGAVES